MSDRSRRRGDGRGGRFRGGTRVWFLLCLLVTADEGVARMMTETRMRGGRTRGQSTDGGAPLRHLDDSRPNDASLVRTAATTQDSQRDEAEEDREGIAHHAVLLEIEHGTTTTALEGRTGCFGVCTAIAVAIAVSSAVAVGVSVGMVVSARQSLLKLESVLKDLLESKVASCTMIRQIVFETKAFQLATRAFVRSVKISVPSSSTSSSNPANEFLRRTGLSGDTDTASNSRKLQGYLDKLLASMDEHSKTTLDALEDVTRASCGSFHSRTETALYEAIHRQHREVRKQTRRLILDAITFVVAAVGAGMGVAADVAAQSARVVVSTAKDIVVTASDVAHTTTEIATDTWHAAQPVLESIEKGSKLLRGDPVAAAIVVADVVKGIASHHVKDVVKAADTPAVMTNMGKIGVKALKGLQVGLAVLGLALAIKKVVDRFIQFFDSKNEYEARNARAEVNAFLYKAEKKHAECSLVNDVRTITSSQKDTMLELLELLEAHGGRKDAVLSSTSSHHDEARDEILSALCAGDVQTCFQAFRGELGGVLAESGVLDRAYAKRIAANAQAGPITDMAISTNADEAAALRRMGFEPVTARPFRGSERLWTCRMCSKYPVVNVQTVSVDARELSKEIGSKKKDRARNVAQFLASRAEGLSAHTIGRETSVEYIKLGPDTNGGKSDVLYLVYARPQAPPEDDSNMRSWHVAYELNVDAPAGTTIGGDSGYSEVVGITRPLLSRELDKGHETKTFRGWFEEFWYTMDPTSTKATTIKIVPLNIQWKDTSLPWFNRDVLASEDDVLEKQCTRTKKKMLMMKVACAARDRRMEFVRQIFPAHGDVTTSDEEGGRAVASTTTASDAASVAVDHKQADVAWMHTLGWCHWWQIRKFGWRQATGTPHDGRDLWFKSVTAKEKKEAPSTFSSVAWSTTSPFGGRFSSGEGKFGPLCGVMAGGWLSEDLVDWGGMEKDEAIDYAANWEFDVAFTMDGTHDALGFEASGWRHLALFKDRGTKLIGYDPHFLYTRVVPDALNSFRRDFRRFYLSDEDPVESYTRAKRDGTLFTDRITMGADRDEVERYIESWKSGIGRPKDDCGTCGSSTRKCAYDQFTVPVELDGADARVVEESVVDEDVGLETGGVTEVRYCKCLSSNDFVRLNEIDQDLSDREIQVGDYVTGASCDRTGVIYGEVVDIVLSEDTDAADEEYKALVKFGVSKPASCAIDKLRRAQRWLHHDGRVKCFDVDPEMVLIGRPRPSIGRLFASTTMTTETVERTYRVALDHHERAKETYQHFLCDVRDEKAMSMASVNPKKAKYVQELQCRFADDPPKKLGSRDDSVDTTFPLLDTVRGVNGRCSWRAPSPRLGGVSLVDVMLWSPTTTPWADDDVGQTYVNRGDVTSEFHTLASSQMRHKLELALTLEDYEAALGFSFTNGHPLSNRATHFLEFMYHAADCRFRTFVPITFSKKSKLGKDCLVKKVYIDDRGKVNEACGEEADVDSAGYSTPLPLLSDVYYLEILFAEPDNKRRRYHGQLHPSLWSNPPKDEIDRAFAHGWVTLPNDVTFEPERVPSGRAPEDEDVLSRFGDGVSKTRRKMMMSDLCCAADAIMIKGDQRRVYGSQDNRAIAVKEAFDDASCDPCQRRTVESCDSVVRESEKTAYWLTKGQDPCLKVCKKMITNWGDVMGDQNCMARCQRMMGLPITAPKIYGYGEPHVEGVKAKLRVWIQPDERVVPANEYTARNAPYTTRCEVCGTNCP